MDIGFSGLAPNDHVRLAKKAEKFGFDCLWLQDGSGWGAISLASSILTSTTRIKVGTGIVSPFRRHPQALAEDAAVLSEESGGRFILGLGSGPSQIKTLGLKVSQVAGLKESVEMIRRLLSGEQFVYPGTVFKLQRPSSLGVTVRSPPPIYLGGLLPNMIRLAAEVADGLLISRRGGSSPKYVGSVLKLVDGVRRRDPSAEEFSVRAFMESSIDKDREKALRVARSVLASYTIPSTPREVMKKAGVRWQEFKSLDDSASSREAAEALVSERTIRNLSMSGTPKDCLEKLESFAGMRLDAPIFYIHGPSHERALELAGEEILPQIKG